MKQVKLIFGLAITLLSVLLLSGCGEEIQPTTLPAQQQEVLPEPVAPAAPVQEEQLPEMELSNCDTFPDKLDACEPFRCEFENPLAEMLGIEDIIMERRIIGLTSDGKCEYSEEMPNKGRMDCKYLESLRKAMAQYTRAAAAAESAGTRTEIDYGSGEAETTPTIDGREVENPLQEALDTGACIISGYN